MFIFVYICSFLFCTVKPSGHPFLFRLEILSLDKTVNAYRFLEFELKCRASNPDIDGNILQI